MTANKHADLMKLAADHWHEAEWRTRNVNGVWSEWFVFAAGAPDWHEFQIYEVRLIQKPLYQSRVRIPEPLREAPENGGCFFTPNNFEEAKYAAFFWHGSRRDFTLLQRGLVYLTHEDAIARAEAMLQTEQGDE